MFPGLEKSNSIARSNAAAYFGRVILNKRNVIEIKLISQIKRIDGEYVGKAATQQGV